MEDVCNILTFVWLCVYVLYGCGLTPKCIMAKEMVPLHNLNNSGKKFVIFIMMNIEYSNTLTGSPGWPGGPGWPFSPCGERNYTETPFN